MNPKDRRQLQTELLKAAIRITWLSCRASLLQAYHAPSSYWASLASDAATFLKTLPNTYVEPHGTIVIPQLKALSETMMQSLTTTSSNSESTDEEAIHPNATENVAYVAMRVTELERETMTSITAGADTIASTLAEENLSMTDGAAEADLP
jgi:hypothetical protein